MERTCYRCGAAIEGQPTFCPSCGAAQIRVTTEQPVGQPSQSNPVVPDVSREPIATGAPVVLPSQAPTPARRRSALPIALPLSILAGFLSIFSLLLGFLVVMGMTIWGVFRYRQQFGEISAGIGARIGALTAFLSFTFFLALHWLASTVRLLPSFLGGSNRREMIKTIQDAAAKNPDPRVQETMRWFTTDQGLTVLFALGMVFLFVIFLVLATSAGAITGSIIPKKSQQQ